MHNVSRQVRNSARMVTMLLVGCGATSTTPSAAIAPSDVVFVGMCDASGAVAIDHGRFIVADDEDNVLRVYDSARGGTPIDSVDVSAFLNLPKKKKPQEADIEAATSVGGVALWITSHGLSSKGKVQAGRFRLFATSLGESGSIAPTGTPYERLLDDLLNVPAIAALGFADASRIPPKEPGGLNLEGMTERVDDTSVFIGFRNPRPQNRAVVIPILNPLAIIAGESARFGEPLLLDLGGLGIRGMSLWRGRYLLLGGAVSRETESRLFVWDGTSPTPTAVPSVGLHDFNPEGFVSYDDRDEVLLLSDDGSALIDGQECKRLEDPQRKRFRGRWVRVEVTE